MPRRADMNIFTKVPGLAQQTRYVETTMTDTPHTRWRSKMRRRRLSGGASNTSPPPIQKKNHLKNDRRATQMWYFSVDLETVSTKRSLWYGWDDSPWLDQLVMDPVPLFLQQAGVCAPTCLLRVQWEGEWHQSVEIFTYKCCVVRLLHPEESPECVCVFNIHLFTSISLEIERKLEMKNSSLETVLVRMIKDDCRC